MVTVRAQEQQRFFFSTLLSVRGKKRQRKSRKEKANRNYSPPFFSFPPFFFFYPPVLNRHRRGLQPPKGSQCGQRRRHLSVLGRHDVSYLGSWARPRITENYQRAAQLRNPTRLWRGGGWSKDLNQIILNSRIGIFWNRIFKIWFEGLNQEIYKFDEMSLNSNSEFVFEGKEFKFWLRIWI
jgi:hypothetical protein